MANTLNVRGITDSFSSADMARRVAAVVAAIFLLLGILGFIPGVTTDYDTMQFAGQDSDALLLGVFNVSILHNIVHLLFGVVGLVMATTTAGARAFLAVGGVVALAWWLYGLLTSDTSSANFVPNDAAGDWLHFALGVIMIGVVAFGAALGRGTTKA